MTIKSPCSLVVSAFLLVAPLCARAQNMTADLVIINANVRTMDKARPSAEAIAVYGNRIAAIGTSGEIRKLAGGQTRIIENK